MKATAQPITQSCLGRLVMQPLRTARSQHFAEVIGTPDLLTQAARYDAREREE